MHGQAVPAEVEDSGRGRYPKRMKNQAGDPAQVGESARVARVRDDLPLINPKQHLMVLYFS